MRKEITGILAGAAAGLLVRSEYERRKLEVCRYAVRTRAVKEPVRLAVLADLHDWSFGKENSRLLAAIEREQPDLVLESIRRYAGTPDQTLPPINLEEEDKNQIDRYLQLAERKSRLDAMRRKIEQEQKTLSIPFVEKLGKNCSAVLLSGNDRYRITYNPTSRKIVNKENITKLENLYPDAYADVVSESVSRTFRVKKEAA